MSARRSIRSSVAMVAAWACAVALLVAAPLALTSSVAPAPAAAAASGADFNPGNIISDAAFYDSNAMSSSEIQAFLERQVRSCASGATCLKDYRQNTDNRPADRYCGGYSGRGNESASTIIDRVARTCGISQKVILVLLQKEQSLVTSTAPSAGAYAAATGQGCPDTAPCDSATLGFFYQVYYAARQYKIYKAFPQDFGYQAGRWNNILYSPYADRNCGTQRVFIENQATAGLYIYTPYVPNKAALDNLYGTGDRCSAYGNRNFWRLYTDWFGSADSDAAHRPFGAIDQIEAYPGGVRVRGWAIDPDTTDAIQVHAYLGNVGTVLTADLDRPDVGAVYPNSGARHGFDARIPAPAGGNGKVCLYAINTGRGSNMTLGCKDVPFYTGSPVGAIDTVAVSSGSVSVSGWALDPDTSSSIAVHAYIDGVGTAVLRADRDRPDLVPHYPAHGSAHGYSATLRVPLDAQNVCLYGIDSGNNGNTTLGCRNIMTPAANDIGRTPMGNLESIDVIGSTARVTGWAIDPDTERSIPVHIYVGGAGSAYAANRNRPDVGSTYPRYGNAHGFSEVIDLPPGSSTVCVYAINTSGPNTTIGCRTVSAMDQGRPPVGNFESATVSGRTATVTGWAIDPDTIRPINVRISVDGKQTQVTARTDRPDVGAAYPAYGSSHGFSQSVELPIGPSRVCVVAVNTAGSDTDLGCRTVTTRDEGRVPIGSVDEVSVSGTTATVRGWAIDPDTAQSIDVHVYAGASGTAITADVDRLDVAAAYPGYGAAHGFHTRVAIPVGVSRLCVYAINTSGPNQLLGCRDVTGLSRTDG